jgi:hypothetical protein
MGMIEQRDAGYDLIGKAETRVWLLNYCKKIEHMESTHEESHGLGARHSTLSSLTQMLLSSLSLYMIVTD